MQFEEEERKGFWIYVNKPTVKVGELAGGEYVAVAVGFSDM